MGPKPYEYGLVGHALPPAPASPPNSPPLLPVLPPSAESYNTPQSRHERHRSSLTPLNLPMTTSAPVPSATTASSRPSTGGSTQPLNPSSQQGLVQPPQQQQPPADFGRNASASATSPSHQASYAATSSFSKRSSNPDGGSGYIAGTSGIGLAMLGGSDEHTYPNRTGSPASLLEQPARILTVANGTSPESGTFSFHGTSSPPSSSVAVPPAAITTAVPQRDGRGRLRMIPPKAPIVHLDGGRVQERILASHGAGGSSSVAGPEPPAYEA